MKAIRGESRNVRRYWMPVVILMLLGVTSVSGFINYRAVQHHNLEVALVGARNVFQMIVLTRQWNSDHGGVYVPVDGRTPPNPYLDHPRRDLRDQFGRDLTMVNPALMTREIAELARRTGYLHLHITSLKPIRAENQADPWETSALLAFEKGLQEQFGLEAYEGRRTLRYMAPLFVSESCMNCHRQQGYRVGDIRGGISVTIDYQPIALAMHDDLGRVVWTHALFLLTSVLGSIVLLEILRQRWSALERTIETLESTRDELVNSEKMASLGRLVAGFAHEINTPMGVAVSAISHGQQSVEELEALLGRDEVAEDELRKPIVAIAEGQQLALANLRRGAELVQRFKRSSIDQMSEEKRNFVLAESIEDVLATLRNELKRLPVQVVVDCPPEVRIFGTPGLIEQLLTNLILNSIRHGFDGGRRAGRITITVTAGEGTSLRIDFADDGVGIAPEIAGRLFEPFVTTRRSDGGSGLGLFVVYNIVRRDLGGTVRCESRPGEGTHFHIEIPLVRDPSAADTIPNQEKLHEDRS